MNQETATQILRAEIEVLISDVEHETIGWNTFKDRVQKSFEDARALEKEQMKKFATTLLTPLSDSASNFVDEQFEKYYETSFIF
jgi:hypothetical protein